MGKVLSNLKGTAFAILLNSPQLLRPLRSLTNYTVTMSSDGLPRQRSCAFVRNPSRMPLLAGRLQVYVMEIRGLLLPIN